MKPIRAIALVILICSIVASAVSVSPAQAPASQPADPNVVAWRFHSDFADGRMFITDGSLVIESRYLPAIAPPAQSIPEASIQRLLQSATEKEFAMADLNERPADGHYLAPGGIQLNKKYINLLKESPLKPSFRFRAKGPLDPILILDGEKVVGVVRGMKPG
jgi:hypothetical protein